MALAQIRTLCRRTFHTGYQVLLFSSSQALPGKYLLGCRTLVHTLLGIPSGLSVFLPLARIQSTAASISAGVSCGGPSAWQEFPFLKFSMITFTFNLLQIFQKFASAIVFHSFTQTSLKFSKN